MQRGADWAAASRRRSNKCVAECGPITHSVVGRRIDASRPDVMASRIEFSSAPVHGIRKVQFGVLSPDEIVMPAACMAIGTISPY